MFPVEEAPILIDRSTRRRLNKMRGESASNWKRSYMRTIKVKSAGRFGIRYGTKSRQAVIKIESAMRAAKKCPSCLRPGLKRESAGIWFCKKCGLKMAGKAYLPA